MSIISGISDRLLIAFVRTLFRIYSCVFVKSVLDTDDLDEVFVNKVNIFPSSESKLSVLQLVNSTF